VHPLALAPATVGDLGPADVVECAAAAGFALCGVRPADPDRDVPAVAAALRRTGVALHDVEYVRIAPGPLTGAQLRTADTAAELGARFLLVVSDDPDAGATAAKLAALRDRLTGSISRVALEPMAFTAVHRLADAAALARQVPGVSVLVDPLHLVRGGDAADAPAHLAPGLLGYAQLCDAGPAPAQPPTPTMNGPSLRPDRTNGPFVGRSGSAAPTGADLLAALAHEARHHRLPPGHGTLPLRAFVAALPPDLPLSVEVHSDRLRAELGPVARARLVHEAARALLQDQEA
jgi:sugar phosphate isomerase/epimerase